ncbi:MAG: AbrB/MazE/SpoVT family DNA-binding protein [Verrucomicrobiaceae bacterium]|nr:AbrB/MazE/SpoVT family DNA-binding protein [Verrucomicrobiaceae bacterium]
MSRTTNALHRIIGDGFSDGFHCKTGDSLNINEPEGFVQAIVFGIVARGRDDAPQHIILMILELRLSKIGDSLGIALPEEALAHLKLQEGDRLLATQTPCHSLRLSPYSDETAKQWL